MAVVISAARGDGRSVTVCQQVAGAQWSVDIGTDRTVADGRRAFVVRRVEGKPEAEDLCQEVWRLFFIRYDHYVEFYDEPVKVLYVIAKCRIAEFWARRGRAREVPFEGEDVTLLIHAIAPDLPTSIERRVDLGRALACLPARQREALHLHYIDSLTIAETAVLMGIGSNGVKKLLKKALERLRDTPALSAYRPEGTGEGVHK